MKLTRTTTSSLLAAVCAVSIAGVSFAEQDATEGSRVTSANTQNAGNASDTSAGNADMNGRTQQAGDRQNNMSKQASDLSPEQAQQMEQDFIEWSANANLYAIEAAKVAQEKAQDQQVQQLARQSQRDHEQAMKQLEQLGQQLGYDVPSSITKDLVQDQLDLLKKQADESPEQIAETYTFGLISSHVEAILWNALTAENCQSQELKQFASKTVPTLKEHKESAMQIAYQLIGGDMQRQLQGQDARTASGRMNNDAGNNQNADDDQTKDSNDDSNDAADQDLPGDKSMEERREQARDKMQRHRNNNYSGYGKKDDEKSGKKKDGEKGDD